MKRKLIVIKLMLKNKTLWLFMVVGIGFVGYLLFLINTTNAPVYTATQLNSININSTSTDDIVSVSSDGLDIVRATTTDNDISISSTTKPITKYTATVLKSAVDTSNAVTVLEGARNLVNVTAPIVKQNFYYLFGGKSNLITGYGFTFSNPSTASSTVALNKIKTYLTKNQNMAIDMMNSANSGMGTTLYNGRYICSIYEYSITIDMNVSKTVSIRCTNRK